MEKNIGCHDVKITHPEKILFPKDGITKQDLINYYRRIAPWILPHIRHRPLALERYPDGIDKPGFFQQAAPFYYPGWIKTVTVKKVGGTVQHVVCDDVATLVYLANQACVTPHIWLSRTDKLDYPDQMVFDLDPSGESFEPVKAAAQSLKALLDQLGLPAYLKTTGSRGLHVVVPLNRSEGFDEVRTVARELAQIIVSQEHERYVRTLAEFQNYRRRVERERASAAEQGKRELLLALLELADDFERALVHVQDSPESVAEGLQVLQRRLARVLNTYGVMPFESVGQPFDPAQHEAVGTVQSDQQAAGSVFDEVARGYRWGDEVLRPARVRVVQESG